MKTLVNKNNPKIRITAPEIVLTVNKEEYWIAGIPQIPRTYLAKDWTLVEEEQKPILEVFGFKVGDAVRLKDGDGRKHIIKSFKEVEGIHGPNFYQVEFEDNSARDGIYPGEEYPNGYYTQMEKFEEGLNKINCPFDKGDCRYCTVQFCGAREENQIETHSTVVIVDCSSKKHPDKFTDFEWIVGNLMFRGCDLDGMTDGEDDNGTVTKLIKDKAAEMMELLERELDPIAEPVDLEKEIRKHTDLFQADIEYPLRLTAIKFYELGKKGGSK